MSRWVFSKLDIDVLVQLALLGPAEADETWKPLTTDPDELGEQLWAANYAAAAAPETDPLPRYRFQALPITVTAAEGLKQVDCYEYQTGAPLDPWPRVGIGRLLDDLRARLLNSLPDYQSAPWGWTSNDLATRAGRPDPLPTGQTPPLDPAVEEVFQRWGAAGLRLTSTSPNQSVNAFLPDPRAVLAFGFHRPLGHLGFSPVNVCVCTDEANAKLLFLRAAIQYQDRRWPDIHIYRFGDVVAITDFRPDTDAQFIPDVDQKIARLGPPDSHWWSHAPPLRQVTAQVLAESVRLSPRTAGGSQDARALVARTPRERDALLELLLDEDIKQLVQAAELGRQTVVLLKGVVQVDRITAGEVREEPGNWHSIRIEELTQRLVLHLEGATMSTGTLLVMDKLPRTPSTVQLIGPYVHEITLIGDVPRPAQQL